MSATYNWSIKSGQAVNRGYLTDTLSMGVSVDTIRPPGGVYVALFGNDTTGNGSRQSPYRTISKACNVVGTSGIVVIGSGVYREQYTGTFSSITFVGDGNVIWEGIGLSTAWVSGNNFLNNITLKNFQGMPSFYNAVNSTFIDIGDGNNYSASRIYGCKFVRITGAVLTLPQQTSPDSCFNNTFINCINLAVANSNLTKYVVWNNIFFNCNLHFSNIAYLSYSIFYNCNVRFNALAGIVPTSYYPATPAGYTEITSYDDLLSAHLIGYPSALVNFEGCAVTDPLFNNPNIEDFTLSLNSPAKNLSYKGTCIGAHLIAYPIVVSTEETTGTFEFASSINISIKDEGLTLTNSSFDGQIDTRVILNLLGRELAGLPSSGFNADRNGQYIDSIADLDTVTKSAGEALTIPASYLVEGSSIVYNGASLTVGNRFTTVEGHPTFAAAIGGVVREILEAPQRHTIMVRFSDGGATVAMGDALVSGYYYYISAGSIIYESIEYTAGTVFKALNPNTFSGDGLVIVAFSNELYQHYEHDVKPTSNNIGNLRTGDIVRGNGDPVYVRGGLGVTEFPINKKFIQIRYRIKVNNLKP